MTVLHRLLLFFVLAAAGPAGAAGWHETVLHEFAVPKRWVHGAPGEPSLQVHEAAPGLWILRQSKASNFEAPFLYLLAGDRRALLLDTGAEPGAGGELPLRATVDRLLGEWQRQRGLDTLPLVVAHSHAHRDHVHGDAQFRDRPDTEVVGAQPQQVAAFFGLDRWPEGEAGFDLGGRALTVLPLPGHEPTHIAIYDAQTATVFSGDSLYPGLLTVRDWPAYRASAARLASFAQRHRVERVLGAHIEMSDRPGQLYPLGSAYQPDERALALDVSSLARWHETCAGLGDFLHEEVGDEFVLARIAQPGEFADPPNIHGMLVAGTDAVYLSHLPMFHRPHDYQLIFQAGLPEDALQRYRADANAHPGEYYTLAPNGPWVLPDTIRPDRRFKADLYRGHFERGGTRILAGIEVKVDRIVHFRRFEPGRKPQPRQWIAFGRGRERFLVHRIEGAPDMDQVVQVTTAHREGERVLADAADAAGSGELKAGSRIGGAMVERVLYTEYGDLAR
jgi:glyoxylase-like metal-dependent hydrolase (beta-lactamase superfamily II)